MDQYNKVPASMGLIFKHARQHILIHITYRKIIELTGRSKAKKETREFWEWDLLFYIESPMKDFLVT